jgi:hypothetical protein
MPFEQLPDHSRLWLLALAAAPDPATQARLGQGLDAIIGPWRHKGQAYQGAWALLEGQIIAVAEPTLAQSPSGCAIDGMLRKIVNLADGLALAIIDPAQAVLVRRGAGLEAIPKAGLERALATGAVDGRTPVLDLTLYCLGELRDGRLASPLASTWIGRKFQLAATAD